MSKKFPIILTLCALTLTVLAACGQNSKNSSAPAPATVSGVATAAVPISGTVTLQDSSSPAQIRTAETTSNGQYSFEVNGLKPPFMLSVETAGTGTNTSMHSFSEGAGVANINPLTDAAAMAADDGSGSQMNHGETGETEYHHRRSAMDAIRKQLAKLFDLYGITSDPASGEYESERSGYSSLFKDITINVSNGTITVTNTATGSVIFTASVNDIAGGTFSPQNMPNPPAAQGGAGLYAADCSSCHGPLATSSKQGATAADIQSAIANVGVMSSLSSLTQQQIQDIAAALTSSPTSTPPPPTSCTYTYSGWGTCQSNNTQTRSMTGSSPAGCTGTPILSQTCTYVPPSPTPCAYTYSAWGTCQSNNIQTRSTAGASPAGCTGTPILSQTCTYVSPASTLTLAQVTSSCASCHGLTVNTTVLKSGGYAITGRTATTWLSTVNRMVGYGTKLASGTTAQDYANFLAALP